jgi:hypothetical protein
MPALRAAPGKGDETAIPAVNAVHKRDARFEIRFACQFVNSLGFVYDRIAKRHEPFDCHFAYVALSHQQLRFAGPADT